MYSRFFRAGYQKHNNFINYRSYTLYILKQLRIKISKKKTLISPLNDY